MSDNIDWNHSSNETNGYIASEATRKQRIEICESCEELTKLKICSVCKCVMPAKVWVKFVDCPQGKWLREPE
jgi:recombinational DNA repair protein RecR